MRKSFAVLLGCVLAVIMSHTPVYAAGQQPYDAGRVMDQVKERPEQAPRKPAEISVSEEKKPYVQAGGGLKVKIEKFHISGATIYSESELQEQIATFVGKEMSLADLQQVTEKIISFYRNSGYFLAYAYLPAQEIKAGLVEITVLEGKVDKVVINKSSDARILNDVLLGGLRGIKNGTVVNKDLLENRLLILSDLPGLDVRSELRPGSVSGTTDLVLDVKEKSLLSGSLDTDNYGNRFSGEYRGGFTLDVNDATGRGDQLTLRGTTAGSGMRYLKSSYAIPVGNYGTRLGIAYAYSNYKLGEEFKDLNQKGETKIVSGFLIHPLSISSNFSLNLRLGYDYRMFSDRVGAVENSKNMSVGNAGMQMSLVDGLGGGGITNAGLYLAGGNLNLGPAVASDLAGTNGFYSKAMLNFSRLQSLMTNSTFFYLSFDGMAAFNNLDTTEKYSLGGAYGVRAYPVGEASGDEGFVSSVELRQNLIFLENTIPGQVQLACFFDVGLVRLNHKEFTGGTDEVTSRAGAGIGLNLGKTGDFAARVSAAWPTGGVPERISDGTNRKPRVFIQAVKWF